MINEDKLKILYNSVLESETITTKKLNEMGFNSKDIIKLMSDSKLKEVNRGIYKVIDIKTVDKNQKPFQNNSRRNPEQCAGQGDVFLVAPCFSLLFIHAYPISLTRTVQVRRVCRRWRHIRSVYYCTRW